MATNPNPAYTVKCDPVTGICTAKLKIHPAGRAYEIPAERRGKIVEDRLKSAGKDGVSAEYLGLGLNIETREVDEARRTILFVCSTAAIDRYGDIIRQDGWQLDNYLRNPVVLWGHDSRSLPIGRALKTFVDKGKLQILAEFASADIYPFADTVFKMVAGGFVNTVSVGFMPTEWEWRFGETDEQTGYKPILGRIYSKQELLENSVVSVPANPEALVVGRNFEAAFRAIEVDETAPDYSAVEQEIENRKIGARIFAEPCERAYFTLRRKGVRRHGSLNPVDTKQVDAEPFCFIWGESFQTISLSTEEKAEVEALDIAESDEEIKEGFLGELVGADIDGRPVYAASVRVERSASDAIVRAGSGKKTQTVIFSKKSWTLPRAKKWCSAHSLKTSDPQHTDSSYRFRQFPPAQCKDGTYETLTENMPKGLSLGVCNKKSSKGVAEQPTQKVSCTCKKTEDDAAALAAALKKIFPAQEEKMGKVETKRRMEKARKHMHSARQQMKDMVSECMESLDQACDMGDAVCDAMSKAFAAGLTRTTADGGDPEDASSELGDETVGDKIRAMHQCMKDCRADSNRGVQAYKGYASRAIAHLRAVCSAMGDTLDKDDPMEGADPGFPPSTDKPQDKTDDPVNPADDPEATNGPGKSLDQLLDEAPITAVNDGASPSQKNDAPPASAENELDLLIRAVSENQDYASTT